MDAELPVEVVVAPLKVGEEGDAGKQLSSVSLDAEKVENDEPAFQSRQLLKGDRIEAMVAEGTEERESGAVE